MVSRTEVTIAGKSVGRVMFWCNEKIKMIIPVVQDYSKYILQLILWWSITILSLSLLGIRLMIDKAFVYSMKGCAWCLEKSSKWGENSRCRIILDRKNESPYLLRHYLLFTDRGKFPFNIFIHKFMQGDDDEDVHDHPWGFFHLVLSGGYWEELANNQNGNLNEGTKRVWRAPGYWKIVDAEYKHRIELGEENPWTIFIPFRKTNEWGFWVQKHVTSADGSIKYKESSWTKVPHEKYLEERKKRSSRRLKEMGKKDM